MKYSCEIDKRRVVGHIDDKPVYMFKGCNRYCVEEESGDVYILEKGHSVDTKGKMDFATLFKKTFYIYNEALQFSNMKNLSYGVILDKRTIYIEGHVYKRFYERKKQIDTLDDIPYEIFPLSGSRFSREKLRSDVAVVHFLNRILPQYDYRNIDPDEESSYIVKYKNILGLSLNGEIVVEEELEDREIGENNVATDEIKEALRLIFKRRVVSAVDGSSAVDIVKEDKAICFEALEKELKKKDSDLTLSHLTKRLGLAKDTLYKTYRSILKKQAPSLKKSKNKFAIYRISYAYLVASNKNLL